VGKADDPLNASDFVLLTRAFPLFSLAVRFS